MRTIGAITDVTGMVTASIVTAVVGAHSTAMLVRVLVRQIARGIETIVAPDRVAGIELSESLSMMPASSVSALVFAHPQSEYFAVGQIGKDQVESYAKRKKMDLSVTERWLSPILNYERD